jgi:hypothetical protein
MASLPSLPTLGLRSARHADATQQPELPPLQTADDPMLVRARRTRARDLARRETSVAPPATR